MSLFVCSKCQNIANTALSRYWFRKEGEQPLCPKCDPEIDDENWEPENGKFYTDKWEYIDGNFVGRRNLD